MFHSFKMSIVSVLVLLLCSCIADKTQYWFPDDIAEQARIARDQSRADIERLDAPLKEKWNCRVVKHNGVKKSEGMWCWLLPEWNHYVCGLSWGQNIEVGCDPKTGEVSDDVLKHEFGHFWLISNYRDCRHDTNFSGCFFRWYDPPRVGIYVTPQTTAEVKEEVLNQYMNSMTNGEWISENGDDTNGVRYHIDFVVIKKD